MYSRAFLLVGFVLISACTGPSEPVAVDAVAAEPISTAAPASPFATTAPTLVAATRHEPAPPAAAIEDALVRLLPVMENQSTARELQPLLREAQLLIGRDVPGTEKRALDRLAARLREIAAGQVDPDLDAAMLALDASR
jgi:hypothetical protein